MQDEWLTCQRNWLYLESIFSAPDIQRQLPAEAKMFMTVDKSWKEIMRKVYRLPNALRAATQPGKIIGAFLVFVLPDYESYALLGTKYRYI